MLILVLKKTFKHKAPFGALFLLIKYPLIFFHAELNAFF